MAGPHAPKSAAEGVLTLLRKVRRAGADPAAVLAGAGAPASWAQISAGRAPALDSAQLAAICRACVTAIGWQAAHPDGRRTMHPDEFRLMCFCLISCATLKDAIERQMLFHRTFWPALSTFTLSRRGGEALIAMDTMRRRKTFGAFLSDLAGLSIFSRLYAWLIGVSIERFELRLAYGAPFSSELVSEFFAGKLAFDAPVNQIAFSQRLLAHPIVRSPQDLEILLQDFPFDFLADRSPETSMAERVRSQYAAALARGVKLPTMSDLAARAETSASTLQRALKDQGLNLQALKDGARRKAAEALLRDPRYTVRDVALKIGFRDLESFRTAFRRWTGDTPGAFRRRIESRE